MLGTNYDICDSKINLVYKKEMSYNPLIDLQLRGKRILI